MSVWIFLSGTYLDSNILPDDNNLEIPAYNLEHSDHLSNKKAEVFIYTTTFKNYRDQSFKESVTFELVVGDKLGNYNITLYIFPSQSQDQFESFKEDVELTLSLRCKISIFSVLSLSNFNTKPRSWCKNDIIKIKGKAIRNIHHSLLN